MAQVEVKAWKVDGKSLLDHGFKLEPNFKFGQVVLVGTDVFIVGTRAV